MNNRKKMKITMHNYNSIILFDSSCNVDNLTNDKIENSLIITFDYNSHRNLEKSGINHVISDSYLDQHFLSSIGKICYDLSQWYTQKSIEKIVEYDGLNLGEFFYTELYEILILFLKNFFEISKIFEENSNASFLASQNLYDIICSFSSDVKTLQSVNSIKSEFDYTHVDIPFKLGSKSSHIRIGRSKYRKLLNVSEKFLNLTTKNQSNKPVILLTNFSPQLYKEFFLAMPKSKNIFVKFDRTTPSFWNYDTYSTIKKSGCITENISSLMNDNIKKLISDSQIFIDKKLNSLDNLEEIKQLFSLNKISFWHAFQKTFFELLRNKFLESITEIEISKKLFSRYKFSCVLVQTETRLNDLVIIKLAKRWNIPVILLQHGIISRSKHLLLPQKFDRTIPFYSNNILVWGNADLKFLAENGVPRKNIKVLGSPFYDHIFNDKISSYTESDNFILFATDFKSLHKLERITVESMQKYETIINSVYRAVKKHNKKLVIRPHPLKDIGEKQIAKKLDPEIKVVIGGSILSLIKSCNLLVVTDNSSVIVEAMALNKPVISVRVDADLDHDPHCDSNACIRTSIEDFENNLSKILENEQFRNSLLENEKTFLAENMANQGSASINTIKFLDNF